MQQLSLGSPREPKFAIRNYQKRVIGEIYFWFRSGKKSIMLVSPTGSGKTLTAVHIIRDALARSCRVLFIVHREPLIDQTVNTLTGYGIPEHKIGYIKAGYPHAEDNEMVIVASVQTLARRDYPKNIGLVIFDECHTTLFFETARQLMSHYAQAPAISLSKVKFLHLTATPFRTNPKEYFGDSVEAIVLAPDIGELIKLGYLVPARHFGYGGIDLKKLSTGKDGDYTPSQVAIACANLKYNQDILDRYLSVCPTKKAIAFCGGVEQSQLLVDLFKKAGVTAEHIQAETPHEVRRQIYERFRTGATQIMSSVGTLTEGFDEPSCEAVLICRPTKSTALLVQMCGRGLRLSPATGKEDCFLLDFGDNFKRLGRIDKPRKISLCPKFTTKEEEETTTKSCPDCGAILHIFVKICPFCGHEFCFEKLEKPDNFLIEFGELFDSETLKKVAYIRGQRKVRFTKKLPPDTLWGLWNQKFPDIILCNDWLHQAVFRGETSTSAQQEFLSYLHFICPNPPPDWIEFHMKVEFGNSDKNFTKKYSSPPISLNLLNWWEVLRVPPLATADLVKKSYQNLVRQIEGDSDAIELLNWAYKQFKIAVGTMKSDEIKAASQDNININVIHWDELIARIDGEMKRLSWTVEKGKQYLLARYGKPSRQLLTDEQIIEFWKYLASQN